MKNFIGGKIESQFAYSCLQEKRIYRKGICNQTYKDFEVIVAKDGNTLKEFIDSIRPSLNYQLIHVQQEDIEYRKNTALNNGFRAASGELIVVSDQDCIPHKKLIEGYA